MYVEKKVVHYNNMLCLHSLTGLRGCLRFVIVVFPDHTRLQFFID